MTRRLEAPGYASNTGVPKIYFFAMGWNYFFRLISHTYIILNVKALYGFIIKIFWKIRKIILGNLTVNADRFWPHCALADLSIVERWLQNLKSLHHDNFCSFSILDGLWQNALPRKILLCPKNWGGIVLNGNKLKWIIGTHDNWKNQDPGGRFGATS